jgi:hypothetical protein
VSYSIVGSWSYPQTESHPSEGYCTECYYTECHHVEYHSAECPSAKCYSAECRSAECHSAEWHSAEWHSAECYSAKCHSAGCHSTHCRGIEPIKLCLSVLEGNSRHSLTQAILVILYFKEEEWHRNIYHKFCCNYFIVLDIQQ